MSWKFSTTGSVEVDLWAVVMSRVVRWTAAPVVMRTGVRCRAAPRGDVVLRATLYITKTRGKQKECGVTIRETSFKSQRDIIRREGYVWL